MNILFLSPNDYPTINIHGLYSDLLRQFISHGDKVFWVSPVPRSKKELETVVEEAGATIVKPIIFNMRKTNVVEKGISMLTIDGIMIRAIKKYFSDVKFDLILYPTPPITFLNVVRFVKKRDNAKTYLLLKDIFPQNAVDIGMLSTTGLKGLIYKYFRNKEKRLYAVSDKIGCMSQANVEYVLKHNPEIDPAKVEVCPNSIEVVDKSINEEQRAAIRNKYGIPLDKKVFVYGGNLGKPQGIPFFVECLKKCASIENIYFLIVGDGTEYRLIENYVKTSQHKNLKLMKRLPKEDYDTLVAACDIGLIFLDHRFTIPNFPSRLLSCMQAKLPVLACTDPNTDVGKVITEGGFGWWCESNNSDTFYDLVKSIVAENNTEMGEKGFNYLQEHYHVSRAYKIIKDSLDGLRK